MWSSSPGDISKDKIPRYLLSAFVLVAAIQLSSIVTEDVMARYISKPLLMPLLAAGVFFSATAPKKGYIIAALFFSFLGDTLLMLETMNPLFFIPGLVAFLVAHLLYIIYFLGLQPKDQSSLKRSPWILLPVLVYGFALTWLLYPSLGALRLPVIVYAITICTMLAASINAYSRVKKRSGILFIAGAILFVISDSLLAINKFYQPIAAASFFIMLTYCAAQFLIVLGVCNQAKANTH